METFFSLIFEFSIDIWSFTPTYVTHVAA